MFVSNEREKAICRKVSQGLLLEIVDAATTQRKHLPRPQLEQKFKFSDIAKP